ncbi:unnamed protein product [Musa banksii]
MRPRSIKQVIIQSEVQLELVRQEIRICFLAGSCHLPFKVTKERLRSHGACLSFPDHLDGTLLDVAQVMQLKQELFSWSLEVPAGNALQFFEDKFASFGKEKDRSHCNYKSYEVP